MATNTLKFVSVSREMPEKRAVDERSADFLEIYRDQIADGAALQASRCSQCGVPFCQQGCPLHNNIPDWLLLTAEGRAREAFDVMASTNNMPEICGRICPQDRLCEGACVIEQSGHGTVTIGAVEKAVSDLAWEEGWVPPIRPAREVGQSVGIVGAGPAGLAAAEQLRWRGYAITVYDRYDQPGGLMIYGIPGFKLEKQVVERRTRRLAESGIVFETECEVGKTVGLTELRDRHDAVLIATGVYKARQLTVPGVGDSTLVPALDYLVASNRKGLGLDVPAFDDGRLNADGKNVVVIGGGDTAMDCVRTAVRQHATSVTCLYRRDAGNMPGSPREVRNAEEEGVRFEWLAAPKAIRADEKGRPTRVLAARMQLGSADASGRRVAEEIPGRHFDVVADMVIAALGFDPDDLPGLFGESALAVNRWGALKVDFGTQMTSLEGVFAAGDIVRGASLVVWALRDGREAAASIADWLQARAR